MMALTEMQIAVMRHIALGFSFTLGARALGMTRSCFAGQFSHASRKLRARNMPDAVAIFIDFVEPHHADYYITAAPL
jgi:DNA-binding CsgD family transcriptional regulator